MSKTPLPTSWKEGDYTVTRTTAWSAPGCHAGCGIVCYVKDGKLEKVEGDHAHPFNQGHICPRCAALPDVVNSPDRLLYPMKRDPSKRGDPDAWEQITWDEALDLIYNEFTRITNEYGAYTLQSFCGTGRDILWQSQRLAYAMGTPHVVSYFSGLACWMPRLVSYNACTGDYMMPDCSECHEDRFDNPTYQLPEVIFNWGCNPVSSSSDGFFGDWIVQCVKRGSKLVVIDPRLTWMAARADLWLQPRPAVDSAIAMAMLKVIIDEDLYDHDWTDRWTYGFEALVERCNEYDLDHLCEVAWVPKEKVIEAARIFAAGKHTCVQLGLSFDMQRHGIGGVRAVIAMLAICNDIDQPGGQIFTAPPYDFSYFSWGFKELPEEIQKQLVGYDEYPFIRMGMVLDQPDLQLVQAEKEEPYAYRGAIMFGTNPMCCMSNADLSRVYPVIQKLEFIAICDWRMTPSIQTFGDVALPVAMNVEKLGMIAKRTGACAMSPIEGLEIKGEPKSDAEIALLLGSRFNKDMWPWANTEEVYDELVKKSGMKWRDIREANWLYPGLEYRRYETGKLRKDGQPGFNTRTGRLELYSVFAESIGDNPLPYYDEPFYGPYTTPELYKEYPVITMTGTRNIYYFHSEHRDIGKLREIQPDPLAEINDVWGKEQGFRDGDWLWIENHIGRMKHRAKLTPIIRYGMANVNSGWWFPEMDPKEDPMYGCWDVNPNLIIEPGHQGPTGFGSDVKAVLTKIYKCEEGEY
ncbi:MAG: molybdopterin-dependent oxidoreductase [Coriobacteriia bacterium]|nr:molybdopterin-dependent oxidoreductase [Coriobacteriia bacterium]